MEIPAHTKIPLWKETGSWFEKTTRKALSRRLIYAPSPALAEVSIATVSRRSRLFGSEGASFQRVWQAIEQ